MNAVKHMTNTTNDKDPLPANFDLVPFDTDDDDMLLKYLDSEEFDLNAESNQATDNVQIPQQSTQVTKMTNSLSNSMPIMPKMFFPHSNVTINYNFSK